MAMVDSGDPDVIIEQLQPFAGISAPSYQQQVVVAAYADVMDNAPGDDHHGQGEPVARSAFVREITPPTPRRRRRCWPAGWCSSSRSARVGGAVADVPADATAYAHRDAGFQVTAMGIDDKRMDRIWDANREHFDGLYLSFETGLGKLADAFPPATLARLQDLKRHYDPANVFRDNFNIEGRQMSDYGHDLLFGTFVTPAIQPVRHAVEQAKAAERAGLDLVTFQDHPYQPRFHDTWTLDVLHRGADLRGSGSAAT